MFSKNLLTTARHIIQEYPLLTTTGEKSVSSLTLPNTAGFLQVYSDFLLYKHWTKDSKRDGPYWTSRENSLVMTDRVIHAV